MSSEQAREFARYARLCVKLAQEADTPELREQLSLSVSQMRARLDVIDGIGFQHAPQVPFPEDHHMIQALTTKRADQPFDMCILPGRSR